MGQPFISAQKWFCKKNPFVFEFKLYTKLKKFSTLFNSQNKIKLKM